MFLSIIDESVRDGNNLELPGLLEVELGGQCRTIFDADEQRQMARAFLKGEHAGSPPRRFYEHIMRLRASSIRHWENTGYKRFK